MKNSPRRKSTQAAEPVDRASGLKQSEREALRAALIARRDQIRAADRARRGALLSDPSEGGDEVDQATRNLDQSIVLRIADKEQRLLGEIEHALAKFEDGSYGVCEGTGDPIGYGRLSLRPWTRYSAAYKELLEREQREARFQTGDRTK
jgi:DnaK suppressor protein